MLINKDVLSGADVAKNFQLLCENPTEQKIFIEALAHGDGALQCSATRLFIDFMRELANTEVDEENASAVAAAKKIVSFFDGDDMSPLL